MDTHSAVYDISDAYAWILYLNPEVHVAEARSVARLDTYILVQDVRLCPGGLKNLPSWMSVLPVLVDTKHRMAYRGASCMSKLATIELPPELVKKASKARRNNWSTADVT